MPTIPLSALQADVLDRVEGNTAMFPVAQVTAVINEGYRIINAFAGINQDTLPVPGGTVANQLVYAMPTTILYPLTAYVDQKQLRRDSLLELARQHRNWATDTTIKMGSIQRWAMIGISKFVLYPIDSVGGRALTVTGVVEPTPLSSGSDVIRIEDELLTMLVEYSAHRLILKEGGKTFADSSLMIQKFYSVMKDRMITTGMKFPRYFVATASEAR